MTPPGEIGPQDIVVVNPDGTTDTMPAAFSYFDPQTAGSPPPLLVGVFPPYGAAEGGEEVTLSGAHFQQGALAFFDNLPVEVTDVQGDSLLTVIAPAHAAGSVDVVVVNPDGQSSLFEGGYVYFVNPPFVASIAPDVGPTTGGNQVTISGSGFKAGLKVYWGDTLLQALIVTPPDEIQLTAPQADEGYIDVTIVNPDGLSATVADGYYYKVPEEAAPPEIGGVSPSHGLSGGGYLAIITGDNFVEGCQVKFGAKAASPVKFLSAQALTVPVPAGQPGVTVDVSVTNPDGKKGILEGAFYYDEAETEPLSILSVTPPSGPVAGGTSVAVVGTGFIDGMTELYIGAEKASGVSVISSNVVTGATPAGSVGAADVVVTTGNESVTLQAGFLYMKEEGPKDPPTIQSVDPSAGPVAGGSLVQIEGTHFEEGAEVLFGGNPAGMVDFQSENLLVAEIPAHAPGTVSVVVVNPDKLSAIFPAGFTYYEETSAKPPVPVGVVPSFGSALGDDLITATGANFATGLSCYVCGNPLVDVVVMSATQFTGRTPPGPVGNCDVEVVNPDGQNGVLDAGFAYQAPQPTLDNIIPSQGPVEGGIEIVLYGTNFMDGMEVWLGVTKSGAVTVFSAETASASVPAGLPGKVDVKIVNPGGLSAVLGLAFEYSENPVIVPPPKIDSLVPASGPVTGGTVVGVNGADFQNDIQVLFAGTPAPDVSFLDESSLLVVTPPGEKGKTDITVLNPDGQGATLKEAFEYIIPTAPAPKLFGAVPASGPESGGSTILVTGANLSGEGMLYLDMKPVDQYTFINASVISGVAPKGTPGPVTISYVGADGQEASLPNGYTYIPAPKIDSLSPEIGPVEGGTEITIVGQNFQPQANVLFGDKPGVNVLVENSLIIHAIAPGGEPGPVDVTIINDDGQSGVAVGGFAYLLAPDATNIAPSVGPENGGTPVSIWGANFVDGVEIYFGDVKALGTQVISADLLLCTSPIHAVGVVDVTVSNLDGQEAMLEAAFEFIPEGGFAPALDSILPDSGPETGGTLVTITGENLGEPDVVLLGDVPVIAFVSIEETSVVFETPEAPPGLVDITFISSGGKSDTLPEAFTYIALEDLKPPPSVVSLTPESGPTTGNTPVMFAGQGFQDGAEVFFGSKKATEVTFNSETELQATTPFYEAGAVDVSVLNPDGQLEVLPAAFVFVPPPVVLAVDPDAGSPQGGTLVTITGTGFFAGNKPADRSNVYLCSDFQAQEGCVKILDQFVTELTVDKIVFETTLHAPGFVDVAVVNPDGQKGFLGGAYYFNEPPLMNSIAPESGPAAGGTPVVISGSGFMAGIKVSFGDQESAIVTLQSENQITAVSPPGEQGLVDVIVENPDTTVDALGEAFLYIEAPLIEKLYPTSGPEAGGTQITIEGKYFSTDEPGAKVYFGDVEVPVEDTNVVSSTIIIVSTPPGQGPAAVTVENPDGQTASLAEAFVYVPPSPPPVINFVIPSYGSGTGGYIVSVIGTGFMEGAQVYFGSPGAWVLATEPKVKNQGTMISCIAPPHDPGVVDVRVVNTNQQEVIANGAFEYTKPQQLPPLGFVSVSPNRSPVEGGLMVSVAGKGFKAGIQVYFGKEPNWVAGTNTKYLGPTIIHTTVPAAQSGEAGLVDIRLINPSQPEDPDSHIAEDAFGYTSGGVFVLKGLRLPADDRDDHVVEMADFNNDGLNDVAVFKYSNKGGQVFTNSESAEFGSAGWFTKTDDLTYANSHTAHGDFDGDGDLDLVMLRSGKFYLQRNNGDGTFAGGEDKGSIPAAAWFTVADFNCDGYLDVFVAGNSTNSKYPNRILVNNGDAGFTHYTTNTLPAHYEYTRKAAAADVDLDGDIDLVLANGSAMQNRLYYNNCNNKDYPPDCYDGMCTVYEFDDHHYAFCGDRNWEDAKAYCEEHGYHLAVINDAAEQAFITSKVGTWQWIGYSDLDEEGVWTWEGGESDYTYWCGGQPNNSGSTEHCAALRWSSNGCWNDTTCSQSRPFVCETALPKMCDPWAFSDAQYGPGKNFPISGFDSTWAELIDVDANGFPDAVVVNSGQQTRVYLNFGGNFEGDDLQHWPQDEENPYFSQLYPADVDLDGDTDIVARVRDPNDDTYTWMRVYTSNYNDDVIPNDEVQGAFKLSENAVPVRMSETVHIDVGDLDGDMLPDIYVSNRNHQDQLLINNGYKDNVNWTDDNRVGVGVFAYNTEVGFPEIYGTYNELQAADIDDDGDLDLVIGRGNATKRLVAYMNDGTGRFVDESELRFPEFEYTVAVSLNSLAIGDIDNDTDLDILVSGTGQCGADQGNHNRVRVLLNDGDGYFEDRTDGNVPFGSTDVFSQLAIADINQDGKQDIFATGYYDCNWWSQSYRRRVLINGGDPFDDGSAYFFDKTADWFKTAFVRPYSAALTDIDGDLLPDLYVGDAHGSYQNKLFYYDQVEGYVDVTNSHLPSVADQSYKINTDDFDADGDIDILVTNWGVDRLHLQEVDHKFADATASNMPQLSRQSHDACVADFDEDGLPDVFTINYDQKNQLYLNMGEANLVDKSDNLPWDQDYGRGCAAADFDEDGDIDVFVTTSGMNRFYFNTNVD